MHHLACIVFPRVGPIFLFCGHRCDLGFHGALAKFLLGATGVLLDGEMMRQLILFEKRIMWQQCDKFTRHIKVAVCKYSYNAILGLNFIYNHTMLRIIIVLPWLYFELHTTIFMTLILDARERGRRHERSRSFPISFPFLPSPWWLHPCRIILIARI
jgi:hypothetical protein